MFQAPFYNRSLKYNIRDFQEHFMQSLMALFLVKRREELLSRIKFCPKFNREDVFFDEFIRFIEKYVNYSSLPIDVTIYFRSSAECKAGTQLGVGGTGNSSRAYAKTFKNNHMRSVQHNTAMTQYFEGKYRAIIRGEKDERVFLDQAKIWDKVAEDTFVLSPKWLSVIDLAYEDDSFLAPIPKSLDKQLVPLAIRNVVVQKHKNIYSNSGLPSINMELNPLIYKETEPVMNTDKSEPSLICKIQIDESLKKLLEEEDW